MDHSKKPSYQTHKLTDSPIYEVSVRIMALNSDCSEVFASGTGVVIAENLILTARHVFEDFSTKYNLQLNSEIQSADNFNIWVIFISKNKEDLYHVYAVANAYINPYADLVLFHLDPFDKTGSPRTWGQVKLAINIPQPGERIVAFGFTKSKVEVTLNSSGEPEIKLDDVPRVSVGEIIEVYPEKRDSYLLNFPSIRINARLEGGMSGGPVFNDQGELIGVVCSSYDEIESEDYVSYVSLLWPLMATMLVDKNDNFYPLYDLAVKDIVKVAGLEKITISKTEHDHLRAVSYKN